MSLTALSTVWEQSKASNGCLLVLMAIGDQADETGFAKPKSYELAAKSRLTERQVRTCIKSLVEMGELELWPDLKGCRILVGEFAAYQGVDPDQHLPAGEKREAMERDGYRCLCCGARARLVADHVKPKSKGGTDALDNYQTLCVSCNSKKGDQEIDYRMEGSSEVSSAVSSSSTPLPPTPPLSPRVDGGPDALFDPGKPTSPPIVPPSNGSKPWPKEVDRKPVKAAHGKLAVEILGSYNEIAGSKLSAKSWLGTIIMRIREYPELTAEDHRLIIERNFAAPWWKGDASPSVIYGNDAVFEKAMRCTGQAVARTRSDRKAQRSEQYREAIAAAQAREQRVRESE